jgi:hypothetical protein
MPTPRFKRDGLHALNDLLYIYALCKAKISGVFKRAKAVFARHLLIFAILLS